jgi:soluble lytic murein transglycosylase-like protein
MSKIPLVALLLLTAVPALAQSPDYSIDNFDIRNGVQIHQEQPKIAPRSTRSSKSRGRAVKSTVSVAPIDTGFALASPLAATPAPLVSSDTSALKGYTTGNAQVDNLLIQSGKNNGVDPLLLYSVMHQESSFKSRAISPKGARGLMQLMPGTAARFGVRNIFDPQQNIEAGTRYLRFLLDRFEGDLKLALAGYNAGEGAVDKYGWRIPPYAETQEYVRRISRRYQLLRDPNAAIFAPRINSAQVARLQSKQSTSLAVYERTVSTVRLPDGRLQLMSQ